MPNNNHYDPIRQKEAKKMEYYDEELLGKKNRRAFKSAAYAFGIAVGFLILSPLLPDMGSSEEESEALLSAFRTIACWMIGYAATTGVAFIFFRKNVYKILTILNWVVVPMIAITMFMEISDILKGQ